MFAQVLLADEINRAGPKTQSALLEAMEEQQVSVDGETRPLPLPFFVIATQNPGDQLGTYALPESQLDRFLMCITLGYPDAQVRARAAGRARIGARRSRRLTPVMTPAELVEIMAAVRQVHVAESLLDYLQALIAATRSGHWFSEGLSPRAGIGVLRLARARALLAGRDFVSPDDLQAILPQAIAHRLHPGAGRGPRPARAGARDDRIGAAALIAMSDATAPPRATRAVVPRRRAAAGAPGGTCAHAAAREPDAHPAQHLHRALARRAGVLRRRCCCCWWCRSTTS